MANEQHGHWDELPHTTPTEAEVKAQIDSIPPGDPMHVAMAFMVGLSDLNDWLLGTFVNPESRPSWDFQSAHDDLREFGEWGIGSEVQYANEHGAEIAYVKILPEVNESMVVTEDSPVTGLWILSLVRRPDINDGWFVQAIGDYWHPPVL